MSARSSAIAAVSVRMPVPSRRFSSIVREPKISRPSGTMEIPKRAMSSGADEVMVLPSKPISPQAATTPAPASGAQKTRLLSDRDVNLDLVAQVGVANRFACANLDRGPRLDDLAGVEHLDVIADLEHQPDIVLDQQHAALQFRDDAADKGCEFGRLRA